MKQQLVISLAVVSLMQLGIGRGLNDDQYVGMNSLSEEDILDLLVRDGLGNEESRDQVDNREELDTEIKSVDYNDEKRVYPEYRQAGAGRGLSAAQKNKVVEIHNVLRQEEGSSDMHSLVGRSMRRNIGPRFCERLAQLAQDWSDRCKFGHRPHGSFRESDYGFDSVGENIWMASGDVGKSIPDKPIQDWFNEKPGFVYSNNYCARPPCGHYTQIVWAATQEVGCGLTRCANLQNSRASNAFFFVCNYGPAGNAMDELPYKKGAACSECASGKFYCTKGLCDHTCRQAGRGDQQCACNVRCENGSPTPDCKCRCNPGFSGVRCSERCGDKDRQCGANPGWPAKWCQDKTNFMYAQVNEKCPKMCGKCK